MKTFGTLIYRVAKIAMFVLMFGVLFQIYSSLEKIATELRISNEMTMCIEDPHCTLDNEI